VDAEPVALPGADTGEVAVPVVGGALGQRDARLPVCVVEEAELDPLRVLREQ
jgi:hypothetical protein